MYFTIYKKTNEIPVNWNEPEFDLRNNDFFLDKDWFTLFSEEVVKDINKVNFATCSFNNNMPEAILPLVRDKDKITSMTNYYSSFFEPIVKRGIKKNYIISCILNEIKNDLQKVSSFWIYPLNKDSDTINILLNHFKKNRFLVIKYFCFGNWYLPCKGITYEEYKQRLSSRLKNTINRKHKKFIKNGGSIYLYTNEDNMHKALVAYKKVYENSWKLSEPHYNFIERLIEYNAKNESLRLAIAWLESEPIACQFWVVRNRKAYIFKLAYDENYMTYSAGTLLTDYMFEKVINEDKVHEIDYLMGDDKYKSDWMSHRRERWGVAAFNPCTLRGFFGGLRHVILPNIKSFLYRE